jgi:hypothetical protein
MLMMIGESAAHRLPEPDECGIAMKKQPESHDQRERVAMDVVRLAKMVEPRAFRTSYI